MGEEHSCHEAGVQPCQEVSSNPEILWWDREPFGRCVSLSSLLLLSRGSDVGASPSSNSLARFYNECGRPFVVDEGMGCWWNLCEYFCNSSPHYVSALVTGFSEAAFCTRKCVDFGACGPNRGQRTWLPQSLVFSLAGGHMSDYRIAPCSLPKSPVCEALLHQRRWPLVLSTLSLTMSSRFVCYTGESFSMQLDQEAQTPHS